MRHFGAIPDENPSLSDKNPFIGRSLCDRVSMKGLSMADDILLQGLTGGRATDLAARNQIIQQHQNDILQRQIVRTCRLTQSTECSIIKRFTTTGNSCPGKAPGRKLTLTNWDVRLFRRHIRKNRHMAVADLVIWARQNFGKTISEASTRLYIKRCGYAF
ncbi:hypothetical protein AVEN_174416-1 [Araneus ventricosus]|uniref:Transposase Tc1-like domain-containing protein n=1 Tax=Araneus ventricosus TaxID=182803 RepID=A0A4Y2SAK1_ARAVE|nr:hypothetical protein AVEN_118069-1 [Araneus ventricosus]GBN84280.1 hypothetical protein AVEN_174416-1 [Araneus ventricosus]